MLDQIRRVVILIVLMEVVLQLQINKKYEPFIKFIMNAMILCSISGLLFGWGNLLEGDQYDLPDVFTIENTMKEFDIKSESDESDIEIETIEQIDKIEIEKVLVGDRD